MRYFKFNLCCYYLAALEAEGISVWVDENAIAPGTAFLREIGEAIVASRIFIVLLSNDSVQSKYCQVINPF